jgi:hypothetical protein
MKSIWNPEAVKQAQLAHDETAEPFARMAAMLKVYSMAEAGTLITNVGEYDLAEALVDNTQPKYIWRNGARVKVKQ